MLLQSYKMIPTSNKIPIEPIDNTDWCEWQVENDSRVPLNASVLQTSSSIKCQSIKVSNFVEYQEMENKRRI